jgi:hypothetical protein
MESGFGRPPASDQSVLEAYAGPRALLAGVGGRKGNDPSALALDLLKVVDSDEPPLRVLLGRPIDDIRAAYEARLATWEEWKGKI